MVVKERVTALQVNKKKKWRLDEPVVDILVVHEPNAAAWTTEGESLLQLPSAASHAFLYVC